MISKDKKRVALTLDFDTYKLYKKVADNSHTTLSKVVDYALFEYVKDHLSQSEIDSLVKN